MEKKYKTRSGLSARILCTDRKDPDLPVIALATGTDGYEAVLCYTKDLTYRLDGLIDSFDLIEVSPYDHIKIDDPVLVYDNPDDKKCKRHFAGVNAEGQPLTWIGGSTSFTTDKTIEWNYCEKVETNS